MDKLALPRHTLRTKSGRFQTCYAVSSGKLDRSLPVLVMVNSWATSIDLYAPQ